MVQAAIEDVRREQARLAARGAKLEHVRADRPRVVALDCQEVVDVRLEARAAQAAPDGSQRLDLFGRACDGYDLTAGLRARGWHGGECNRGICRPPAPGRSSSAPSRLRAWPSGVDRGPWSTSSIRSRSTSSVL